MTRRQAVVVTSGLLVVAAVLLVVFVLQLSSKPNAKVNLGTSTFKVGNAERFAKPIARDGPLLFQDLLNKSRDIYVQHIGSDPKTGWIAFESHANSEPRTCQLRWRRSTHDFLDPCSKEVVPADGAGLVHYKVTVDPDGVVIVDLRSPVTTP
jgi:hypothetical protein